MTDAQALRRLQAVAMVTFASILYFGVMLWSTCAGIECGSLHSSIWPRIGMLCLPFVGVVYFAWHARSAEAGAGLMVSASVLLLATIVSGWAVANSPSSNPNANGSTLSEHTSAAVSVVVVIILMAIPLVLAGAMIGSAHLRESVARAWSRSRLRYMVAATLVAGAVISVTLCFTPALGITGVDISPPSAAGSLAADPGASANAYVVLRQCPDARLVNCRVVDNNVTQGSSYDLAPGIYTLASNPPANVTCGTVPATMYLFPFERIQVQYLNVSCQSGLAQP